MAEHRLYLDTHYIDYLWDHRRNVWNEPQEWSPPRFTSQGVSVPPKDDYVSLEAFHDLCLLNDWRLVIGDQVLKELHMIADRHRREELVEYAETLASIESTLGPDLNRTHERESENDGDMVLSPLQMSLWSDIDPSRFQVSSSPSPRSDRLRLLATFPASDRPLVEEALALGCDVFLTTDTRLQRRAVPFQKLGLRVQSWLDFLVDEFAVQQEHGHETRTHWPDIAAYSIAIPSDIE